MEDIIDLNNLSPEILEQVPFSIRLNNDKVKFNELPNSIQYLLINYVETEKESYDLTDTKDFNHYLSIYNDFRKVDQLKDLVTYYIRNFISTFKGSYPFYPDFGNEIKYYLQKQDTVVKSLSLNQEFNKIVSLIEGQFGYNIEIALNDVDKREHENYTSFVYNLKINVKELESDIILSIDHHV